MVTITPLLLALALQEPVVQAGSLRLELGLADRPDRLLVDGRGVLETPPEGPWSVGVGWRDDWPAVWYHGAPNEHARHGEWLVTRGTLETPDGPWEIRDAWRPRGASVEGLRRWTWQGAASSPPTVLALRWLAPGRGTGVVLPGLVYHGNPSGERSRAEGWAGLVPLWHGAVGEGAPGERAFFQEHRFPAPFASIEWAEEGGADAFGLGAALHAAPSPLAYAARPDLWWSLGLWAREGGTELALLSGPVALNGEAGRVKSGQRDATPLGEAYLVVPPGGVVEKRFWLQGYGVEREGSGFQRALAGAIALHGPFDARGLPPLEETLRAKLRYALSRWRGDDPRPGFAMYPHDRDLYVMGWCGQAAAPGYALQVLAPRLADARHDAPALLDMARRSLDVLAEAPFDAGGFRLAVNGHTGEWSRQDPVSQGQAMSTFARAIRAGRAQGADTAAWERFLRQACAVHAGRILEPEWHPRSTAEAFLVQPLCLGAELFDEPRWLAAARKAGQHYAARHLAMREPYWGGTLDAQCEDKEGAWAAFEAFLALFETTGEERWLHAAEHAADVALTYTYLWDVDLPPGRLRDRGLRTTGWTSVSVQNMHLDVFGVVYTPELMRLAELTGRRELRDLAELMLRTCGQLIGPDGSQGEQLQQTRFAQAGDLSNPERFRGGYVEGWTVFWITAHFLTAAAKLEELGLLGELWEAD